MKHANNKKQPTSGFKKERNVFVRLYVDTYI